MPRAKANPIHVRAQHLAIRFLVNKYRDEYKEKYRAHVIELGGTVHPSKEQRIAHLKKQIEELEGERV
jgi:hypothetical protein